MTQTQNRVAIVTGASRGIGRATAFRLARGGMKVVLCARTAELLESAKKEIEAAGGSALSIACDLRDAEAADRIVAETTAAFGGIDAVVNNAGATKRGAFRQLTDEDWADGFALKFFGAVRLTRVAWPHLRHRAGSVVNIAGSGGRTPGPEFTIGGSVNAAMLSFTKALADLGIADGVQVSAINPGPVRTARLENRLAQTAEKHQVSPDEALKIFIRNERIMRVGEPEDIAELIWFLLSPHGRLLHGSLIDADGGSTKTI